MFKKSRWKIVASILSVLVLLLFGTLCLIYLVSYAEMTRENRELLRQYVDGYSLPGEEGVGNPEEESRGTPGGGRQIGGPGGPPDEIPFLELSTFYSVVLSKDGQILKVDTSELSTGSVDELTELALKIVESGKENGIENHLIYRMADKSSYTLVAFLNNAVMMKSAGTLMNYTLIFGSAALVLMFFLARYLADRIVAPLEEGYQRQKQFVSDAGHELKTPVAAVNANLELLSREIGPNPWLSNIQYENERMLSLVIQLLDLAKAENAAPPMETLDLSRLVCGESLPFETVAYEKRLVLNSAISEDIYVYGNSVQLKQLTSILLDNAIHYGGGGKEVRLTLAKEKNHAVLAVVNDGEEISPEQKKQLFERFYRTDLARTGEERRYGLGLAIAKAIIVTHKGSIDVQCYDGKVEFTVKIPLQK